MDVAQLIAHLTTEGDRLAEAADRVGWAAPVPGIEWNVGELVTHVGGVHRWAADIVDTASPIGDTSAGRVVGSGPPLDELLEWYVNGHAALVQTLRDAPDDLDCFTFLPADSPRHFWARRQAHETAIHRADAQAAAGDRADVTPFDADFAQDGIAEILTGFARRRSEVPTPAATMLLEAMDATPWLVRLGGERIEAAPAAVDDAGADVTVRGLSSDLYLWLWNRPSEAVVDGDPSVAAAWRRRVRVRWS